MARFRSGIVTSWRLLGEVIYTHGRFTRVSREGALRALHGDLSRAPAGDEVERRKQSKALLPHVQAF